MSVRLMWLLVIWGFVAGSRCGKDHHPPLLFRFMTNFCRLHHPTASQVPHRGLPDVPHSAMPTKEEMIAAAEQRALKHAKQGQKAKHNAMRLKLKAILDRKPELSHCLLEHLKNIGEVDDDEDESKLGKTTSSSKSTSAATPLAAPTIDTEGCGRSGDGELSRPVPMIYLTLGSTPARPWLEGIISRLEPVSLGKFALKALLKGRSKHVNKSDLLQLIERMTNYNVNTPFADDSRNIEETMLPEMIQLNEMRGRPCRDLKLPFDWEKDGAYSLSAHQGAIWLSFKMLRICRALPSAIAKQITATGALYIDSNYSDRSATLRERATRFEFAIVTLFPEAGGNFDAVLDSPPRAKKPFMILDRDQHECVATKRVRLSTKVSNKEVQWYDIKGEAIKLQDTVKQDGNKAASSGVPIAATLDESNLVPPSPRG